MPATKEQIRQIIADNNLSSVADVYSIDSQEIFSRNHKKIADYHHYIQRRRSR